MDYWELQDTIETGLGIAFFITIFCFLFFLVFVLAHRRNQLFWITTMLGGEFLLFYTAYQLSYEIILPYAEQRLYDLETGIVVTTYIIILPPTIFPIMMLILLFIIRKRRDEEPSQWNVYQ